MLPALCHGDHRGGNALAERPDLLGATPMIRTAGERQQAHEDQGQDDHEHDKQAFHERIPPHRRT